MLDVSTYNLTYNLLLLRKFDTVVLTHVVRSVSIIFEFPQGADYQNSDPYVDNSWLCSLNSFVCHFQVFGPKIGQKQLK